ncbi:MAG: hypothetical protein K9L74_05880 [Candidatus Izimaplasma sp.]|nr:hypothetical protein [Candidatus Izimaplasma bacterium]
MKKEVYIGLSVIIVIILIILVANIIEPSPKETTNSYCDRHEDSLFCDGNDYPTDIIVLSLFNDIINKPQTAETYCKDYFIGNLESYCLNDSILPTDYYAIMSPYAIEKINNQEFRINTMYDSGEKAYEFYISIKQIDEIYKVSGFSYKVNGFVDNLYLSEEKVTDFISQVLTTSSIESNDYCETYFIDEARQACQEDIGFIIPSSNLTIVEMLIESNVNEFIVYVYNTDQSISYQFTVLFDNDPYNELYIRKISYSKITE